VIDYRKETAYLCFSARSILSRENCVSELINAWRYSGGTWDRFDQRVKFYVLPCADIFDKEGARADLKSYWHAAWMALKTKHEGLDPAIMASFDSPERREIDMLTNSRPSSSAELRKLLRQLVGRSAIK
jgi:hypothetical protein